MNNVRYITSALLRNLPTENQGTRDQEFQRVVLSALVQLGDQMNALDTRLQQMENLLRQVHYNQR